MAAAMLRNWIISASSAHQLPQLKWKISNVLRAKKAKVIEMAHYNIRPHRRKSRKVNLIINR